MPPHPWEELTLSAVWVAQWWWNSREHSVGCRSHLGGWLLQGRSCGKLCCNTSYRLRPRGIPLKSPSVGIPEVKRWRRAKILWPILKIPSMGRGDPTTCLGAEDALRLQPHRFRASCSEQEPPVKAWTCQLCSMRITQTWLNSLAIEWMYRDHCCDIL